MSETQNKARNLGDEPYNPDFGDDRACICGHPYYRHFDGYENNANVGCKYCSFSSQAELDSYLAEKPDMAEYVKRTEWCPGFTPADGIDTPDELYEIYKQFAANVAQQAEALFAKHPGLDLRVARAWRDSTADRLMGSTLDKVARESAGLPLDDPYDQYDY